MQEIRIKLLVNLFAHPHVSGFTLVPSTPIDIVNRVCAKAIGGKFIVLYFASFFLCISPLLSLLLVKLNSIIKSQGKQIK